MTATIGSIGSYERKNCQRSPTRGEGRGGGHLFKHTSFTATARATSCRRLGLHLTELAAAKAYDRVAIKKWGPDEAANKINFPLNQYNLAELQDMTMADLVTTVRGGVSFECPHT